MAKLKIFDSNNTALQIPSKEGYRNVATQLIADLPNFDSASDKDRSDLLQKYANYGGTNHIIYQLTKDNPPQEVPIDKTNCKVNLEYDVKKMGGNVGKHNLVLPEILVTDPPLSTGYLAPYVQAIVQLYGTGTAPEVQSACEFLFGIMLLTRCR